MPIREPTGRRAPARELQSSFLRRVAGVGVLTAPSAHRPALFAAALIAVCCASQRACAEDAVYLSSPANPQGRTKVTGRVLDYNGRELVLQTSGGEKRYPAEQVAQVDSDYSPTQLAADERYSEFDFAAALPAYEQALRGEKRRWVQRKILARIIWCLRNLDQYRRAGELFLALVRDDPAMLYFNSIP